MTSSTHYSRYSLLLNIKLFSLNVINLSSLSYNYNYPIIFFYHHSGGITLWNINNPFHPARVMPQPTVNNDDDTFAMMGFSCLSSPGWVYDVKWDPLGNGTITQLNTATLHNIAQHKAVHNTLCHYMNPYQLGIPDQQHYLYQHTMSPSVYITLDDISLYIILSIHLTHTHPPFLHPPPNSPFSPLVFGCFTNRYLRWFQ